MGWNESLLKVGVSNEEILGLGVRFNIVPTLNPWLWDSSKDFYGLDNQWHESGWWATWLASHSHAWAVYRT